MIVVPFNLQEVIDRKEILILQHLFWYGLQFSFRRFFASWQNAEDNQRSCQVSRTQDVLTARVVMTRLPSLVVTYSLLESSVIECKKSAHYF